jgi:rhodanese-related sulfurtransferase
VIEVSEDFEEKKKKYLEVARMLRMGAPVSEISRGLRVSGHMIKDVKRLIEGGYITYSEDGEPLFIGDIREAEMYLTQYQKMGRSIRRNLTSEMSPESIVASTVMEKTAEEARQRTEAKLTVGEVAIYILEQLRKDGFDPSQYPPEKVIPEMYQAWKELPKVKRELEELQQLLEYYQKEYSPLEHARNIIRLMNESALALAILKKAGFKLSKESAPVKLYNHLINQYASKLII